ncbi:hypothetical protein NEMBOFW57_009488 [Staphylotrichum longicolle]|uniref:Chromo domain-containing protein n=1 Tax=Staphylotrichum longicolle TaxID=669026 RepID=A0AAD4ET56_9PEZI|nr:hypothetical protein NEMBOFW57_009488 [Staphylotrichum longicolle]
MAGWKLLVKWKGEEETWEPYENMAETKALGEIDFDTALAACGLVAGNRWSDGFFSSDRSGAVSVERPDDGILREPQYFFQLPAVLTKLIGVLGDVIGQLAQAVTNDGDGQGRGRLAEFHLVGEEGAGDTAGQLASEYP